MQFTPSPASSVRASRASDGVPLSDALSHRSVSSTANAPTDLNPASSLVAPKTPSQENSTEYGAKPAGEARFGSGEERPRPSMPVSSDSVLSLESLHPHDLSGAPVSHKQHTPPAASPEIERPRPPMPLTSDSVLSVPSMHPHEPRTEHHIASSTAEIRPTPTTSNSTGSETWSTDGNAPTASAASFGTLNGDGMSPAERYASMHSGGAGGHSTGLEALGAPVQSRDSNTSTLTGKNEHKPSLGEKVGGTLEKAVGKLTGNEDKVEHGEAKMRGGLV